jgi:DNA replication protein DnaC
MTDVDKEIETVTLQCPKHGEYTGHVITIKFPGKKDYSLNPECPECQKEIEAEKLREKEEQAKQQAIRKLRSMNIDERYDDSTLDNFDAYNNELKKYLDICRAFAEKPDGKLVMLGKNGNGKTHLAIGVLKKLGGVIYTASEIAINIRASYRDDAETKEDEVFYELCSVPLLVIDEVEKIKESEWKSHWMSHIIGKRYNRMLPIIFISNCHLKKNCTEQDKPCPYCLEYHLENDVLSRIFEDGVIMEFNSGDYRRKIRQARFNL